MRLIVSIGACLVVIGADHGGRLIGTDVKLRRIEVRLQSVQHCCWAGESSTVGMTTLLAILVLLFTNPDWLGVLRLCAGEIPCVDIVDKGKGSL
jgi:hypothetical protein